MTEAYKIIDHTYDVIVVAAGFSGHGFKFCSVVGEVLAELSLTSTSRHDIAMFRLSRFG